MWHEKEREFTKWGDGAARYLSAKGIVPPNTPWYDRGKDRYLPPYAELFTSFFTEQGPLAQYDTPDEAAAAFVSWVESKYRMTGQEQHGTFTVRCRVMNMAKLEVEFEYSAHFDDETPEQRSYAWEFCSRTVREAVGSYLAQSPIASGVNEGANLSHEGKSETFLAKWISTEFTGGKRLYKLGGEYPFTVHGLRVWPEVLTEAGIDPASLPLGNSDLPQAARCTIMYNGPKPMKVVKIEWMSRSGEN